MTTLGETQNKLSVFSTLIHHMV